MAVRDRHSETALLVHAPKSAETYPLLGTHEFVEMPAMGLFSLAGEAVRRGHRVSITHLGVERRLDPRFALAQLVDRLGADTVGFSLHWHHQTADVLREAAALRAARPGVRIVFGGATASHFARPLVEGAHADVVLRGEADRTFADLLDRAPSEGLEGIPGSVWRDGEAVVEEPGWHVPGSGDLDGYSFFDRRLLIHPEEVIERYALPWLRALGWRERAAGGLIEIPRLFPLTTVRGCPRECAFCAGSRSSQRRLCGRRKLAVRSGEEAARTAHAAADAGFTSLLFEYLREGRTEAEALVLVEALARARRFDKVVAECRDLPSEPFLEALGELARGGTAVRVHLSPGFADRGARERFVDHPMGDGELFESIRSCERWSVGVQVFFVVGMAGETGADHARMEALVRDLRGRPSVEAIHVHSVPLEPGSPLAEAPERHGICPVVQALEDYADLHARPSFPPPLGYTVGGRDPRGFDRDVQEVLCHRFCRLEDSSGRDPREPRDLLARGAALVCRHGPGRIGRR